MHRFRRSGNERTTKPLDQSLGRGVFACLRKEAIATAGTKKRKVVVDKRVAARIAAANAETKEENLDKAIDVEVPNDGVDHMRWPPFARALARLMVSPDAIGLTQSELALQCGTSERSVNRYLNNPEFKAYMNELADKVYAAECQPLFVRAMVNGLSKGEAKFVELYMKSRGMLKEVRQTTVEATVNDATKKDDLDAEVERLERAAGIHRDVN